MPIVDFTDVKSGGFDLLPQGDYLLQVEGTEEKDSQSSEFPYLNVKFVVLEPEDFAGRFVWDIMSYSPKALFKLKNFLRACGVTEEELVGEFELDTETLLGTEVHARISQKKDSRPEVDELRNVVSKYMLA